MTELEERQARGAKAMAEWEEECRLAREAEWGGRDGEVLVITGSRRHPNRAMVERYLRWYFPQLPKNTVIRTGGAEGVDQLAEKIAGEIGLPTETLRPFYLAYPREPKRAPLERNTVMVNGGVLRDVMWHPCHKVLAFPDNLEGKGGTWDTIRKGKAAGVPTAVIGPDGAKIKQVDIIINAAHNACVLTPDSERQLDEWQ